MQLQRCLWKPSAKNNYSGISGIWSRRFEQEPQKGLKLILIRLSPLILTVTELIMRNGVDLWVVRQWDSLFFLHVSSRTVNLTFFLTGRITMETFCFGYLNWFNWKWSILALVSVKKYCLYHSHGHEVFEPHKSHPSAYEHINVLLLRR